jgi:ribose 5-phosphate isomerase A
MVHDGAVLGLGSGRAARAFVTALGERVRAGLRVRGVPTSESTAQLAREVGIPLTTLEEVQELDIDFDGADEVDPKLDLIKGLGGALVREKIVASSARKFVVLVGSEKLVPVLGSHGKLPVEVVPYGLALCKKRFEKMGLAYQLRLNQQSAPFITDNSNQILDCLVKPMADAAELHRAIRAIPGVVDTGLFLGMAHTVIVADGAAVRVIERGNP